MSSSVSVFNKTLEKSHSWLKEIVEDCELDNEQQAYTILRAVLHALRDRLTVGEAAHLGAQLPMLIRGLYYEGFKPAALPHKDEKTQEGFTDAVYRHLGNIEFPIDVEDAIGGIFMLLETRISQGEISHIKSVLPKAIREMWEESIIEVKSLDESLEDEQ